MSRRSRLVNTRLSSSFNFLQEECVAACELVGERRPAPLSSSVVPALAACPRNINKKQKNQFADCETVRDQGVERSKLYPPLSPFSVCATAVITPVLLMMIVSDLGGARARAHGRARCQVQP